MLHTVISEMILYFEQDTRRINHALKVYGFAATIGKLENLSETEQLTLELASVLHDIGIKESERKYHSAAARYQEEEGPPVAEEILKRCGVEEKIIARVLYLIGNHHSYHKIDGADFQILVEADFLVNIDEGGMDLPSITSILQKYFKTEDGRNILKSMYLLP